MTAKPWNVRSYGHGHVVPYALSIALVASSALWLVSAGVFYANNLAADWSRAPLLWMLMLMITPPICFAVGIDLVNTRKQSRLSRFDWCALAAGVLPVTLGSFLAVKIGGSINGLSQLPEDTAIMLRVFAVLASLALVVISAMMVQRTVRNYLSGKRGDES